MSKKQNNEAVLDNWLAVRRLAQFCPTSLSIDDLHSITVRSYDKKSSDASEDMSKHKYIPPSPSVTSEEVVYSSKEAPKKSRFGFLLHDVKQEEKHKKLSKMQYELSNMTKIKTPGKLGDSLIIVSLSNNNISELGKRVHNEKEGKQLPHRGAPNTKSSENSDYSD